MASYSGNLNGEKRLFVFDRDGGTGATQATFVKSIPIDYPGLAGATTAYVTSGGKTYGTTAEIYQFVGNRIYDNYQRQQTRTITSFSEGEGITSTVVSFTPDPRIHIGVYVAGTSQTGLTGDHMDEIHLTANDGTVYQSFLGKITYSEENSDIAADRCLVDLIAYGISGSSDPSTLYTMGVGKTLANKTNGCTAQIKASNVNLYVDIDSHKQGILGQVGASLDSANIFGTTIGDAGASQNVFCDINNKDLISFCSTVLPAFVNGGTGAFGRTERQTSIFTMLAGVTGELDNVDSALENAVFGITFNAVTGGSGSLESAFEEFCHAVLHKHAGTINNKGNVVKQINDVNSIRDVDDISF